MVDAVASGSPFNNLQPFGGSGPVEPERQQQRPIQLELPSDPGPLRQLQDAISGSGIDTEELAARAVQSFGEEGASVVSQETGEADLNALSRLIAEERTTATTDRLVSQFGEGAGEFVSDTGEVDRPALQQFLSDRGIEEELPEPRETGFGGADVTGYNPAGQANRAAAPNFLNLVA